MNGAAQTGMAEEQRRQSMAVFAEARFEKRPQHLCDGLLDHSIQHRWTPMGSMTKRKQETKAGAGSYDRSGLAKSRPEGEGNTGGGLVEDQRGTA
jgi:hypothetical protein